MNPNYSYQFVDLMSENVLAEIPLSNVRFSKLLNDSGVFSATLTIDEILRLKGIDVYDITTPVKRCLYILRDGVPMWGGLIWTRSYNSDSHNVQLAGADFWSYYDHRKILQLLPAAPVPFDAVAHLSSTSGLVDQNIIARSFIQVGDLHPGGDINIQLDSSLSGITRERVFEGYELAEIGDGMRKLANVIDGPDMTFDVALDINGVTRRHLRLGDPQLGQQGSPHVWEFGGNIQSYTWPSDGSRMATRMFAVGNGIEKGTPIAVAEETARYALGWPLLESEQGYSTVSTFAVLQEHADSDQLASRAPVVLPALIVRGDLPPVLGTYAVGDDALVIIQDEFHPNGIETLMRIVQMEIAPGEEQGEQVKLIMAPLIDEVTF